MFEKYSRIHFTRISAKLQNVFSFIGLKRALIISLDLRRFHYLVVVGSLVKRFLFLYGWIERMSVFSLSEKSGSANGFLSTFYNSSE